MGKPGRGEVWPVAEVGRLLGLPTPVSAYWLERACTATVARGHFRRLGFAVHIDWLTRMVVFSRLVRGGAEESPDRGAAHDP